MKAGVSLQLEKYKIFPDQVDYSGHKILPGKLAASSNTCETVKHLKPLRTTTDVS